MKTKSQKTGFVSPLTLECSAPHTHTHELVCSSATTSEVKALAGFHGSSSVNRL